jgi:pimeloyl-ACP methyl ester carboxylesterase
VLTTSVVTGAGADLYVERRGSGPPLLLIVGGGGDCGYYGRLADILADEFTVLSYDRRGNSRSPLHVGPGPLVMAEQSADALAVLAANGFASALVFGNSGGATIALDLAAHHPGRLDAVVAHEPPVPVVLPDPASYLATFDEIDRLLHAEGWVAAFSLFQARLGLVPERVIATLLDPGPRLPPGPLREQMLRVSRNWEYMTRYEIRSFIGYRPDLRRIAANHVPVALARGATTSDLAAIQISEAAAGQLGVECAVFPGGHTAPMEVPGEFAVALRPLLHRLQAAGAGEEPPVRS